MPFVANNLTEVRIKVESETGDKLQGVQNNMLIKSVEEKKVNNQKLLLFKCDLLTTFLKGKEEPLAQFMVSEDLLYAGPEKELQEIMKEWEKNKKMPKGLDDRIIEGINTICMYDLQFFTNKMRFPPVTGYNMNVKKEGKKEKKEKSKKKK